MFVQEGQILTGHVKMVANTRQSYDVEIELVVPDSDTKVCAFVRQANLVPLNTNGFPFAHPIWLTSFWLPGTSI